MKRFILLIIILTSCSDSTNETVAQKTNKGDTLITRDTLLTTQQSLDEDSIPLSNDETQLKYIVSVAEGYNYDTLRRVALEVSKVLKFKFDTMDRYYNRTRKKILYPANYEKDDIYAGQYFLRRFGDSVVSIEMRSYYEDTLSNKDENTRLLFDSDTSRMFVFANQSHNTIFSFLGDSMGYTFFGRIL